MDTILAAIRQAATDDDLKALAAMLRAQEEVLFRHAMALDEMCESLAAPTHTLGLVFVLNVRASALAQASSSPLAAAFVQRCRQLLLNADRAQVALAPTEFNRLCAKFLTFALPQPQGALTAVGALLAAAAALQPSPSHITPIHPLVLQAAILAKTYRAVVPLLDESLVQIDVARTAVSAHDVLLLNYYSGIALIGLKKHTRAMQAFQLALVSPSVVLNNILVEAYKKWTLCALIATRTVPSLPKYTATAITRHVRAATPAYNELAAAFTSRDASRLSKALAQHGPAFQKDGNGGLVKQVAAAFTKECIDRLSRTYVTLSLADIAAAAGLGSAAEAEAMLLQMADKGELHGQVDRVRGMALFAGSDAADSEELKGALDARLEAVVALSQKLHALHDELAGDPNYLAKIGEKGERGSGRAHLLSHIGADDMSVM